MANTNLGIKKDDEIGRDVSLYSTPQIKQPISPNPGIKPQSPEVKDNPYLDEIQKAMHEKNYKALLQNDIAAYNLKANAQKYYENELAAQGLGTQGYGTSAHVGIENQAANLYAQNLENYNEAEANALADAQQRQVANATEADNQLITFLQYSDGSEESIKGYMDKYGYEQDKDGNWVNKQTKEPASPYIQAALQSVRENASNSAANYSTQSSPATVSGAENALQNWASKYEGVSQDGYASVNDLRSVKVGHKDNREGKSDTLKNIVGNELNYLEARINTGTIQDGTLFKLQRGGGYGEAYLILYLNGRLYVVSDDDREQDEYQVSSRYNSYQGPKEEIKGK